MNHSTEIKRPDGNKVQISVNTSLNRPTPTQDIWVTVKGKGKRTWVPVTKIDDESWLKLDAKGREQHNRKKCMEHVSEEEIVAAAKAAWLALTPEYKIEDFRFG